MKLRDIAIILASSLYGLYLGFEKPPVIYGVIVAQPPFRMRIDFERAGTNAYGPMAAPSIQARR
jgi:hypothetical protein